MTAITLDASESLIGPGGLRALGFIDDYTGQYDWKWETCCRKEEYIFLALYVFYGLGIHILFHRGKILYPFKLLGVFVHEVRFV